MKLYLASNNRHKAFEMNLLARATGRDIEILPASEAGGMPPVVEDTGSFIGNARKKARALKEKLPAGAWVLADDSGLCVDALNGLPGVESAYYAGPQADPRANLEKLVRDLREVPEGKRGAHFCCILFLITPEGNEYCFEGLCKGRLLTAPQGGSGFGYDPLFVPDGCTETFAQLGEDIKNTLSHRARAWQKLAARFSRERNPEK